MACNWLMIRSTLCPNLVRIKSNEDFCHVFIDEILRYKFGRVDERVDAVRGKINLQRDADMLSDFYQSYILQTW